RLQLDQRLLQGALGLVRLGREELERVRAARGEQVGDLGHGPSSVGVVSSTYRVESTRYVLRAIGATAASLRRRRRGRRSRPSGRSWPARATRWAPTP